MTILQVINLAFVKLGQKPISQAVLDANTNPGAVAANALWENTVQSMIEEYPWGALTEFEDLTITAVDTNKTTYEFQYDLPSNFIAPVRLFVEDDYTALEYKILGTKLYTDYEDVRLEYIYDAEVTGDIDPSLMRPKFLEALTLKLASELSLSVIGDGAMQRKDYFYKQYQAMLIKAEKSDTKEMNVPPPTTNFSGYINARRW